MPKKASDSNFLGNSVDIFYFAHTRRMFKSCWLFLSTPRPASYSLHLLPNNKDKRTWPCITCGVLVKGCGVEIHRVTSLKLVKTLNKYGFAAWNMWGIVGREMRTETTGLRGSRQQKRPTTREWRYTRNGSFTGGKQQAAADIIKIIRTKGKWEEDQKN